MTYQVIEVDRILPRASCGISAGLGQMLVFVHNLAKISWLMSYVQNHTRYTVDIYKGSTEQSKVKVFTVYLDNGTAT